MAMSNEGWRNASKFLSLGVCPGDMNSTFGQHPNPSSPLPRSSSHRKEAQAHRLDWSYKFWPFPDLTKRRSREISHSSLGTYKSDWLWDSCTGKTSLGVTFMSASIWVFWNPYVLEIRITLTRNSARKMEGSAFFNSISTCRPTKHLF